MQQQTSTVASAQEQAAIEDGVRRLLANQRGVIPPLAPAGVVCKHWTRSVDGHGYGQISINGRSHKTHRAMLMLVLGTPIPDGTEVCHSCDVYWPKGDITYRRCMEPTHLVCESHEANMQHGIEIGRVVWPPKAFEHWTKRPGPARDRWLVLFRGDTHPRSKLSRATVLEARHRYAAGEPASDLAQEYGVGSVTMWHALIGVNWKDVPDAVPNSHRRGARTGDLHYARRRPDLVLRGSRNGAARYSTEQVADVKRRLAAGEGVNAIARRFGMSPAQVSRIKTGRARVVS